jgi:hypothetical protein
MADSADEGLMGLRETIIAGIKTGMSALGNVKETVTYKAYQTTSSYDPTTGAVTRTETSYTVEGIFLDYKKREIDNANVFVRDQKFLFLQSELAVTPSLQDRLTRSGGKSWEVIWVEQDPATATWELQVRAISG